MSEGVTRPHSGAINEDNAELSLEDVAGILSRNWLIIFVVPVVVAVATYIGTYLLENKYEATVLVTPSKEMQALSGSNDSLNGTLSGLSNLAGLGLGSLGGEQTGVYLAELKSRSLLLEFARRYNLAKALFPEWTSSHGQAPVVVGETRGALEDWEVYEALEGAIDTEADPQTGVITIKFLWKDRGDSARLANALVALLNERVKNRALAQASSNLAYLEERLSQHGPSSLIEATSRLTEAQLRQHMLANGVEEYAFDVIDPALPPIRPARPRRVVISGLVFVVTAAITSMLVLLRERRRKHVVAR